jgi:1-deoxy-D-xylulose-5-phosphate synthase
MKHFQKIPEDRPVTELLDTIDSPTDLKKLSIEQLPQLADELREFLLYSVGVSGGHFGSGLGVIELTIALHYVYETPNDSLVWDVGHQAYPHKILTGRREELVNIRKKEGLAAFPSRYESEHDAFGVGHSSTSISAAQGMAIANRQLNNGHKAVAIIGDGALTAGMAFEAMNHAGHDLTDMLVILNDNDMAISESVGALSKSLSKVFGSKTYSSLREGSRRILGKVPHMWEFASRMEEHMKGMVTPGIMFEELGFNYIGPVDGHDVVSLVKALRNIRNFKRPQFLHVATRKGMGFIPAEDDPIGFHAIGKIAAKGSSAPSSPKYSNVFGQWLCDTAAQDEKLMAITPAMREGSDLIKFSEDYPERYFDVAIAEQHAVTVAAGMACNGVKPVVAIYSTFLQRGYDQLIHDVAIQNLDVLFAIDRAGLVGEDGATHNGAYDLSFMRCIPNMVIMAPKDEYECRQMLTTGYQHKGPAAVRYPRGTGPGVEVIQDFSTIEIGKGEVVRQGEQIALLAFGSMVAYVADLAEQHNCTLANMRFIKPLDNALIIELAHSHDTLICIEENAIAGGAGSAVAEFILSQGLDVKLKLLGLQDKFIEQGTLQQCLDEAGLSKANISKSIEAARLTPKT